MKRIVGVAFVVLALAGCDDKTATTAGSAAAPAPMAMARAADAAKAKLAYSHRISLQMPGASVKPRFERARDLCANDAAMRCVLQNASINLTEDGAIGHLSVRLPHEAVEPFEKQVIAPLNGQTDPAFVAAVNTQVEDLSKPVADNAQRRNELTDYRSRLVELAQRADAKVDDLIKVAHELSSVDTQLAGLTGDEERLSARIDTELLDINFQPSPSAIDALGPVRTTWRNAGAILGRNVAAALQFSIGALPWLPVVLITYLLLWIGVRRLRR